ncbi:MAG: hypothetical protein ACI4SH_04925 [Candidatus Scatosoma sp.]
MEEKIFTLKENRTGNTACYPTCLTVSGATDRIVFKFLAERSSLFAPYKGYNEPLFDGDVCEIFIGGKANYYEIEVAPNGAVLFAKIKNYGDNGFSTVLLPLSEKEKLLVTSASVFDGGYGVEIGIERSAFEEKDLFFNAFRIDTDGGEKAEKHTFSVFPTLRKSFHLSEAFGKLEL